MEALAIPVLLAVGALLAVQAAANVQLSAAVGSPAAGATLQLLTHAPTWHLVGGVASALYISAGIVLFPRLGAIVTVGLFIAGQMLASLALDTAGWLGVEARPAGPAP